MGWICIPDKFNTLACVYTDDMWKVLSQSLCCLLDCVCFGNHPFYADIIRWIPTCSNLRAHDVTWCIRFMPDSQLH